jgi:DNA invertase Pin-like site-specific DNA recombinase
MSNMLDKFQKANTRFISLKENIDTEQVTGKLLIYIISICAEIERDNISEYVKMAKKQEFESRKSHSKSRFRL